MSGIRTVQRIQIGEEEPRLTVGIPAFQTGAVSWLVLAGLSRQSDAPVPWEIVICQEDDSFRESDIEEYESDLAAAGCSCIRIVQLEDWVHLSTKWRVIRDHVAETSEVFLLQGADDCPHKTRVIRSWESLQDPEVDWFQWRDMLFYDFNFQAWSIFQGSEKPPLSVPKMGWTHHPCNPNMATRTKYLDFLPDEEVRRGVDGWIFYSIQAQLGRTPNIGHGPEGEHATGFGTTGFNTLSMGRIKQARRPQPPMFPIDHSLNGILTENELERLRELSHEAQERTLHLLLDELEAKDHTLESLKSFARKYRWVRVAARPLLYGKAILNKMRVIGTRCFRLERNEERRNAERLNRLEKDVEEIRGKVERE